ncbi:hypothetical protein N8I77_009865 [Diaporthe amygdali]|uniref:Xylanolytic transcriptional activator regulatory domain-containing protein n=1 Tax=Phomopsis amygdali TaxID=1214568 RepID=A0AAD9SAR6_PHOAM|nr:hypothetical protein N8I77_009865 [Diaporthe amygdali]
MACGMSESNISDVVRADLDEIYFEHVHAMTPIVHKRRYLSWAGQEDVPPARECLRLAMRTIAAAVSSTSSPLSETLYAETRRILDTLDLLQPTTVQLEHIQAGLLVSHYELMRLREHDAMLIAGRTFRLIHSSRLYDVDGTLALTSVSPTKMDGSSFSEMEEKRRTFWLAFVLDRFLSTRNEWPVTLQEETNNEAIQMSVLSEAITSNDHKSLSCFAECIVLASLHGRCLTLRRLAHAAAAADMNWRSAWSRVERLTVVLEKRADRLLQATPPAASILVERDPMLVFSHILAQNAIIHLYHTSQPLPFQPEEYTSPVAGFSGEQRAYQAAVYTAHMALSVPSISCFKF